AKSPVGQELNFGVVAPAVASPRSAVRVDDAGQALRVAAGGQGQIAVNLQAVAAGVADGLHRRHIGLGNGRIDVGEFVQSARCSLKQIAGARRTIVVGGND